MEKLLEHLEEYEPVYLVLLAIFFVALGIYIL